MNAETSSARVTPLHRTTLGDANEVSKEGRMSSDLGSARAVTPCQRRPQRRTLLPVGEPGLPLLASPTLACHVVSCHVTSRHIMSCRSCRAMAGRRGWEGEVQKETPKIKTTSWHA